MLLKVEIITIWFSRRVKQNQNWLGVGRRAAFSLDHRRRDNILGPAFPLCLFLDEGAWLGVVGWRLEGCWDVGRWTLDVGPRTKGCPWLKVESKFLFAK